MFVTLEGVEGSGKSTLVRRLDKILREQGLETLVTLEPGGSELGRHIRPMLLSISQKISPEAELFLFLADRAEHVSSVIRPALARGAVVLCDRYTDSTAAYQGYGRGLDHSMLEKLNRIAACGLAPDLTFLLDLPAEIGLRRARSRNEAANAEAEEGRFEAEEAAFHRRVRHGFLVRAAAEPNRFCVLDATGTPEEIAGEAARVLLDRMGLGQ